MTNPKISQRQWLNYTIVIGVIALATYFFSSVFHFLPWTIDRPLFLISGPSYALAIYCLGQWLHRDYDSISMRLAILMNIIAGVVNGMMAAVQSLNSAVISEKIKATTDSDLIVQYKTAFLATNNTQLGLDIAWDIWINLGTAMFAFAIIKHFAFRPWLGILGICIALASFVNNMITFPWPPASRGSIDLGPFIGVWWGLVLIVIIMQATGKKQSHT